MTTPHVRKGTPPKVYVSVYAVLLALTGLTVAAARFDLGRFNLAIALAIAGTKALAVIVYFMHARSAGRLIWLFAGAGFFWLAILITLSLYDPLTRGWLPPPEW
ncbi:MAG: cytochrome C oxidase subunit IV family protein [Planctomycetes bacterium]|nr:cytochrome C oxidase subunit IV family protein [Planctomycetota bacterium]